jgi:hypothetical protein
MVLPYGATLCNEYAGGDGEGDEEECGRKCRGLGEDAYEEEEKRVYGETVLALAGASLPGFLRCMATYHA